MDAIKQDVKKNFKECKKVVNIGTNMFIRIGHDTDIDRVGDYLIHWEYLPARKDYSIMA